MTNAMTYEAQIRAMNLPKVTERKMLKAIGVEVVEELFEATSYTVPVDSKSNGGKTFPMLTIKGVSKSVSGKAVLAIASNPMEFFSHVAENASHYGVVFTAEQIAAIDLLTGNSEVE